jgi:hypothetical protein
MSKVSYFNHRDVIPTNNPLRRFCTEGMTAL